MDGENKTALSAAHVDEELQTLEGWTRSEAVLARHFVFHTFEEITAFLTHLVRIITVQNHHPDFSLHTGLKMVAVALTTHSEQAITRADIQFARALNAWTRASGAGYCRSPSVVSYSPKRRSRKPSDL
jgi:pterin-4a-carbinolamine dehydratase